MRKAKIALTLVLSILVSACGSASSISTPAGITPRTGTTLPNMSGSMPGSNCSAITVRPTPGADVPSVFQKVSAGDHILGPEDAAVTMTVYSDYQCGGCAELASLFKQLRRLYPDDLRIVFRNFPLLDTHDKSGLAAQAAEAANEQGKFWDMHDVLYAKLDEWKALPAAQFERWLTSEALTIGMDPEKFQADLVREDIVARVKKAWEDGKSIGLPGAPILLVNGQLQGPPINAYTLDQVIRLITLGKRQFTACPPFIINPLKQYFATLHTDKGDIVIQLFADKAPNTVNNFVYLAQQGWYDHVTFHRVIPGFVAQTGDPSGTGMGNPGYFIPDEVDPTMQFDRPGLVSMANVGPDTNGGQFFITFAPAPHLNGSYTIFGEVISGLAVLSKLTPRDSQPGTFLPPGDSLLNVTVEEK
jgi:cyclophilin family peptidyl-prolyl cis-trans isomerase/protein-disulfide isomerase